jgi:putative endonuclease
MYLVYVLRSIRDAKNYIGMTSDLERRLREHNAGRVPSTKIRRPFELIYSEKFENKDLAEKRERFFKTGKGFEVLKNVLKQPPTKTLGG